MRGHFDSLSICVHCHERNRQRQRRRIDHTIGRFHSQLCKSHCLGYADRPLYKPCRCQLFLEEIRRCYCCSLITFNVLQLRSMLSGEMFDKTKRQFIKICPMARCTSRPWDSGPLDKQMLMCRACTGISHVDIKRRCMGCQLIHD